MSASCGSIEEKIDIPESRKDDFRREIMNYIGALAIEGRTFDYKTNERLHKALGAEVVRRSKGHDQAHVSLVSNVVDRTTQEKIDVVKTRLIKNYGYCEICSTDVLNFVASIFARGDVKKAGNGRRILEKGDDHRLCIRTDVFRRGVQRI